jgi:alkaline phosphatase
LSWNGTGRVIAAEEKKLNEFIAEAHREGKKVRLWGGPDVKAVWAFLLTRGVDLINTDKLEELALFLNSQEK